MCGDTRGVEKTDRKLKVRALFDLCGQSTIGADYLRCDGCMRENAALAVARETLVAQLPLWVGELLL